jgi:hypothetical protein
MVNYATDMEMTKFLKCLLIGIFNLSLYYCKTDGLNKMYIGTK